MIKLLSLSRSLQPNSSNGFNTVEEINKVTNLVFSTKLFKCSYCLVVFFALQKSVSYAVFFMVKWMKQLVTWQINADQWQFTSHYYSSPNAILKVNLLFNVLPHSDYLKFYLITRLPSTEISWGLSSNSLLKLMGFYPFPVEKLEECYLLLFSIDERQHLNNIVTNTKTETISPKLKLE